MNKKFLQAFIITTDVMVVGASAFAPIKIQAEELQIAITTPDELILPIELLDYDADNLLF